MKSLKVRYNGNAYTLYLQANPSREDVVNALTSHLRIVENRPFEEALLEKVPMLPKDVIIEGAYFPSYMRPQN